MTIEVGKFYQTRNGMKARIYATDGGGIYPVHGAGLLEGYWTLLSWDSNGKIHNFSDFDLVCEWGKVSSKDLSANSSGVEKWDFPVMKTKKDVLDQLDKDWQNGLITAQQYSERVDELYKTYNGNLQDDVDLESFKEEPYDNAKCECGAEASGIGGHSSYCPKFKPFNE